MYIQFKFSKIFVINVKKQLTISGNHSIIVVYYDREKKVSILEMELTKSEMEIMDVLWDSGKPLSRSDLLERSDGKTWKDSSVHILLNGLLQKGAIREAGMVKRSKTYGRVFAPTMTREEYFADTIFCHRHKPEITGLFAALLRREDITQDDLAQIQQLVSNKLH